MPGYDDPRFLQQKIEKLERDLAELRRATLPFAVTQRGAIPGAMRAVSINDPRQPGSMWANYQNTGPGSGPYSAVTDPNNVVRAEWGNLAANGVSPAQYGFRANDATGAPIFDSQGLIAVLVHLGFGISTGGTTTSATPAVLTGTPVTFSLARQSRVFYVIRAVGVSNVTYGFVDPYIDGVNQYSGALAFGAGTQAVTSSWSLSSLLSAGSHTLDLRYYLGTTPGSFQVVGANTDVYLEGAN